MLYLFLLAEKNKVRSSNITLALSIGVRALGEGCRLGGFSREIKGFSRQPLTAAGIFFLGLWIPYGYLKISDSLQNRRLLPLRYQSADFVIFEIKFQSI